MDKDTKSLLKAARAQGFIVKFTKNGHPIVINPETGERVVMAGTASDHRSFANAVARLRRIGMQWPPRR